MEKLNFTKINGVKYRLPEGFYAINGRFGDQVYDQHGKNVTSKIMGGLDVEYIILTDKGIQELARL